MNLSIAGTVVCIDGKHVDVGSQVKEAFALGDKVIVLLDPDATSSKQGQFRNLMAFSRTGERVWVAELPTDEPMDSYFRVATRIPLKADSFCSYECVIDPETGRITSKTFFK